MFTKSTSAAVVAFAASLVSAQTFTDCNPLEKTCPSNPAFGGVVTCDFSKGPCSAFEELPGTSLEYNEQGAVFAIEKESNAPTIATHKYIFFGRIDVECQASVGQGIVTSAVLQSADLDEIDWEWVGGDANQAQSNYFGKGDTTTYDRGAYHDVANALTSVNTYSVEWTKDKIDWIINGNVVRTLAYADAKGGSRFPQTPMEVKLGTWVAGRKDAPEGTVEWAGGYTDFSKAPFNAYYKSITITDYAGGDSPANGGVKEYVWTDKTGSFESIRVVKGDGSSDGGDGESTTTSTTKAPKPTTTTKAPQSETETSTSAEETTSSEVETTSKASTKTTSTTVETTLATVTSSETTTAAASTTTTESTPEATPTDDGSSSGAQDEAPGAASRGVIFGSAFIATVGLMLSQLLL
jgi:beta-glucanase (GH16 family)